MFFHRKELMYDVKVQGADPRFGEMLLEQFGGATGELNAALTYWTHQPAPQGSAPQEVKNPDDERRTAKAAQQRVSA
jgi:Mn-containing catalase